MNVPLAAVDFDGVEVTVGGRVVWSEGTFSVPSGSVVAVIGPNGAGKTTLLRVILGLLDPTRGTVFVLGDRPRRGDPRIGYVPQHNRAGSIDTLRCVDLVMLGLTGSRFGAKAATRAEREAVDAALRGVDAVDYARQRVATLSGGQQQRVAIARALVSSPEVLLLDEPLASLDVRSQHGIVELLGQLLEQRATTIFIVAHDLNPLLAIATSAIYLVDGHAHYGAIGDVVDADLLSHLYGTPMRVVRTPQGELFTRQG